MAGPSRFFDFNDVYFRLSEVVSITTEISNRTLTLIVILRDGQHFEHKDYNGSARKIERRLLEALENSER